eukprot:scaffold29678_cov57-Phaeocystis_antarctica.AAC.4
MVLADRLRVADDGEGFRELDEARPLRREGDVHGGDLEAEAPLAVRRGDRGDAQLQLGAAVLARDVGLARERRQLHAGRHLGEVLIHEHHLPHNAHGVEMEEEPLRRDEPGRVGPSRQGAGAEGGDGGVRGGERECGWGELGLQSERRTRSLAGGVQHGDLEADGSLVEHKGSGLPNAVVGLEYDGHLERRRGGHEHFGSDLGRGQVGSRPRVGPLVWELIPRRRPHLGNTSSSSGLVGISQLPRHHLRRRPGKRRGQYGRGGPRGGGCAGYVGCGSGDRGGGGGGQRCSAVRCGSCSCDGSHGSGG